MFPAAIVAIVLGHIARRQIRQTGEEGRGLATAGLILGYAWFGILFVAGVIGGVLASIHAG